MTRVMRQWGCVLVAVLFCAAGCDRSERPVGRDESGRTGVLVSIAPHAWLVRQIAGDTVRVITLVRPGESPHTYQPGDAQISEAMHCAAYFRAGVPFERGPWMDAVVSARRGPKVVDLWEPMTVLPSVTRGRGADETHATAERGPSPQGAREHEDAHEHDHEHNHEDGFDPHAWLAPQHLTTQAQAIATTLTELLPDHAATFAVNLASLRHEISRTDRIVAERLAPLVARRFYVFHPAWGYFAQAYGLEQVAVEVAGQQPAEHELTRIQQAARHDGVRVLFVQPQISGRTAQAVAKAMGGRTVVLDPLAENVLANLLEVAEAIAGALQPPDGPGMPSTQPSTQPSTATTTTATTPAPFIEGSDRP